VAEPAVASLLESALDPLGLPSGVLHTLSFVLALSIVVFFHMVIGEMVPKNVAIAAPEQSLLWLALPVRLYATLFRPVIRLLNALANLGLRTLRIEPRDELAVTHTADELAVMLAASREQGLLEEFEHGLLRGALGFGERKVATIMVPRASVQGISRTATVAEAEQVVVETGHSRLLVYGRDIDDVLGFIHAKDLLRLPASARDHQLPAGRIRRMLLLPGDRRLEEVLIAMRRARVHVALVVDGSGRTAGLVTLEDVLEELVGEIRDEHDPVGTHRGRRRRM
jgi:CBS domain containing-hemolysin-like protein